LLLLYLASVPTENNDTNETTPVTDVRSTISKWSREDVLTWLQSSELDNIIEPDALQKHLDGEVLVHLFDLRKEVSIII